MGQKDRETSNEVLLLTNLCIHHEKTIKEMFDVQEPILKYARLMRFMTEYSDYVDFKELDRCSAEWEFLDCLEDYITIWERDMDMKYKPVWSET